MELRIIKSKLEKGQFIKGYGRIINFEHYIREQQEYGKRKKVTNNT